MTFFIEFCSIFDNVMGKLLGYAGTKCERCAYGYYGFPSIPGGSCTPCNCNAAGSASDECDEETGQCNCRPGSTGRDCSECTAPRHVLINDVCTCKFLPQKNIHFFPQDPEIPYFSSSIHRDNSISLFYFSL